MRKLSVLISMVMLAVFVNTATAAPSEQKIQEVLDFAKEFIMKESKNSGIFKLERPGTADVQWFELYGILGEVKNVKDKYVVTVDVDVLGYEDRNYLLYFIVKEPSEGQYNLDEIRIGPRFTRKDSQKLSIPE